MSDPLTLVAMALGIAATALQLLSKKPITPEVREKEIRENVGKEIAEVELRVTNCCREDLQKLEERIRDRVHTQANRVVEQGLRIENNSNDIKALWRELDKRQKPRN